MKGPAARIPAGAMRADTLPKRSAPTLNSPAPRAPETAPKVPEKQIITNARPREEAPVVIPQATYVEPRSDVMPEDNVESSLDSQYERVELPSGFVFYEWQDISLRRLDPFDQAKLARAVRHRNLTLLIDVLTSTCNRDVRDLSVSDFRALCLWHKNNSYLKNPLRISYNSIYGNRVDGVAATGIITKESKLQKTRADYLEAQTKGFAISTVRDLEVVDGYDIDEDMLYLFEKAQYIDPAPLQERIDALSAAGDRIAAIKARVEHLKVLAKGRLIDEVFAELDEFRDNFADFGVQEIARVRDPNFSPDKALRFIDSALLEITDTESDIYEEMSAERERIASALEKDTKIEAKIEEVPLTFDQWSMFPYT